MEKFKDYEVLRIPSLVESGYEVVDTATMSLTQRMIACLGNDKMADVQLVGDDGIKINACKFVLGSASPNLQTLLYQGKEKSTVNIPNCRAKTIRALVEFSCSDMLNTAIWADTEPVEIVEDMIALAKLGEQYTLPNLKQQVSDVLSPCLEQLPSLACVAYNLVDTKTTPELHAAALDVLRKKPYQAFVKGPGGEIGGIACLSPDKLDTIFRDSEVNAEEIFLFQCLQEWRAANVDLYANVDQICRMVAQNLDFSAMNATDIEDIVLPSGVVDSGSLVSGLMTLAKAAEKKGISLRSSRRKLKKGSDSTASTNSFSRGGRGRRFKKPESAHMPSSAASLDESYTTAEVSQVDEKRDDAAIAPVPVVQAPAAPLPPPRVPKKNRSLGFRRPNGYLTRFLGGLSTLKSHSVKESPSEQDSVATPMPKAPPQQEKSVERKAPDSDIEETSEEATSEEQHKERPKELVSNE